MKLDKTSVQNLIGNASEVTVYGFSSCEWDNLMFALEELGIKINSWDDTRFPIIDFEKFSYRDTIARRCKAVITSLVIENYKRSLTNKPLIPLIFCIGLATKDELIELNESQLATSRSISSITEKELRRCYKLFAETTPEIKSIAEATFKFVRLKQDPYDSNLYQLEPIQPFWEKNFWEYAWQERRKNSTPEISSKEYYWRSILPAAIANFKSAFFKPTNNKVQESQIRNHSMESVGKN